VKFWTVCPASPHVEHRQAPSNVTDAGRLRAAGRLTPLVNSSRLRLARESHGWTQGQLVAEMDPPISPAALSQLERGLTKPNAATLVALADATGFPPEYFVRRDGDHEIDGFFRSLRSAPARERKWALARAHLLHDLLLALDHHVQMPEPNYPSIAIGESGSVEQIAASVRRAWGKPTKPIKNVVRLLERHGVVVARMPLRSHKLDAFSVRFPDWPIVVLGDDKRVTARSRFDAAHELGHLVMHSTADVGDKRAEDEAHRFAAAFLMPAEEIGPKLPTSADWGLLLDLKVEWGVSLGALLMRAKTLGIMSDYRYLSAVKFMSARGWRTREPGDEHLGRPEQPRLIDAALQGLDIELEELVDEAALPLEPIREILNTGGDPRTKIRF